MDLLRNRRIILTKLWPLRRAQVILMLCRSQRANLARVSGCICVQIPARSEQVHQLRLALFRERQGETTATRASPGSEFAVWKSAAGLGRAAWRKLLCPGAAARRLKVSESSEHPNLLSAGSTERMFRIVAVMYNLYSAGAFAFASRARASCHCHVVGFWAEASNDKPPLWGLGAG